MFHKFSKTPFPRPVDLTLVYRIEGVPKKADVIEITCLLLEFERPSTNLNAKMRQMTD